MSDISEIKNNTDIVQIIGRFVDLKRDGIHYKGQCPFHEDKTASLVVTGSIKKYKCFGCKEGGDVFDFLVKMGRTFPEAIQYLSDQNNTSATPYAGEKLESQSKEKAIVWKQIIPGIEKAGMFHHYKHGMPSMQWAYRNEKGQLVGYICRFDLKDGKQVLPLIYAKNDTREAWIYKGFEKPRILMNADKIATSGSEVAILVVEGEKTVKAAERLYPNVVVTTWIGGSDGVKSADFSILKDRVVVLWPDNDSPGFKAMHAVHNIIKSSAKKITWTNPPKEMEKGWDLADATWDVVAAREYAKKNTIDYPGKALQWIKPEEPKSLEERIPEYAEDDGLNDQQFVESVLKASEESKAKKKANNGPPNDQDPDDYRIRGSEFFKMLGAKKEGNGMVFFFYAFSTRTVIGLSPSAMTRNNIMQLAPLTWWQNEFYDPKASFAVDEAADYLINVSARVGTFSEKRLRGRGAWVDGKNVVIHNGANLFVNGKQMELTEFNSKYIYEIGEDLGHSLKDPLKNTESAKLIPLLSLLNWSRPLDAYLLAGWTVIAPFCGALKWRPHIWLNGPSGTGKSTIFQKVIAQLLGNSAVMLQGETSEPGIRQRLGADALPVMFDEAEGQDQKALARMESILALVRSSSTSDGGDISKGAPGGGAGKTYLAHSCFAFASVGYSAKQQADLSRITVLTLISSAEQKAKDNWVKFQKDYDETISEVYSESLRARTISIFGNILENIKTFSNAVAAIVGEQRSGDQTGVLLAAAFSLVSDKVISYDEAYNWCKDRDLNEEKSISQTKDEVMLYQFILQQKITVETEYAKVERNVGELVLIAMQMVSAGFAITADHANESLKRIGMKVKDGYLYISNSDMNIQKMLYNSAWSRNHNKILMRLPGAIAENSARFASGVSTRAVRIPKDTLFGDFKEDVSSVTDKPKDPEKPAVVDHGIKSEPNDELFNNPEIDY